MIGLSQPVLVFFSRLTLLLWLCKSTLSHFPLEDYRSPMIAAHTCNQALSKIHINLVIGSFDSAALLRTRRYPRLKDMVRTNVTFKYREKQAQKQLERVLSLEKRGFINCTILTIVTFLTSEWGMTIRFTAKHYRAEEYKSGCQQAVATDTTMNFKAVVFYPVNSSQCKCIYPKTIG